MIVERDIGATMRDGVVLRMDVYRPDVVAPCPVVLARTCYQRRRGGIPEAALDPERATAAGIAVAVQDVRGMGDSDGEFEPFSSEGRDGVDTIAWLAAQQWCDGNVAMAGRSYVGATQWLAAVESPPALRAICPTVTGSDFYDGWIYQGGAFQLGFNLFWVKLMTGMRGKLDPLYRHLPLDEVPIADGEAMRLYRTWLDHPTDGAFWRALSIRQRLDRVAVAALVVGGWYDLFLGGTLENYRGLRERGASAEAREHTRLVIGPWGHGSIAGEFPDHRYPGLDGSELDLASLQLAFLAAALRADPPPAGPPVRLFVMGANRWRDEDDWPLARAREERWHLRAGGELTREPPPADEPSDTFVHDPEDPVPTIGGPTSLPAAMMRTNSGPLDQAPAESRDDVLVYTTAALPEPLEITGPLKLVLHAATDARDTDWVGRLCVVDREGRSRVLAEGVVRARYATAPYEVDLVATSVELAPGERLRIVVCSSSFPRFDRNLGDGGPAASAAQPRVAHQTVFHDAAHPSHVVLPVVA